MCKWIWTKVRSATYVNVPWNLFQRGKWFWSERKVTSRIHTYFMKQSNNGTLIISCLSWIKWQPYSEQILSYKRWSKKMRGLSHQPNPITTLLHIGFIENSCSISIIFAFDLMLSCDSQVANPRFRVSTFVAVTAMYGEYRLWLSYQGMNLQCCGIITGSSRAVSFASWVQGVERVICELQVFHEWPVNGNVTLVSSSSSPDEKYALQQLLPIMHSTSLLRWNSPQQEIE